MNDPRVKSLIIQLVLVASLCAAPTLPLDLDGAVRTALIANPELRALRKQHDLAAADVRISRVYPHNPVLASKMRGVHPAPGDPLPASFTQEHNVSIDVEIYGQPRLRRRIADQALSRTDREVAAQEQLFAIRAARAFDSVVYRRLKLQNLEDTRVLVERAEREVDRATQLGLLRGADPLLTRAESNDARAAVDTSRIAFNAAFTDLRRVLGSPDGSLTLTGTFELPLPPAADTGALTRHALDERPDLAALKIAVGEAIARRDLDVADRYGNPNLALVYEKDPSDTELAGIQLTVPIPVADDHRFIIRRRAEEIDKSALEAGQQEVAVRQDVRAALARMARGRTAAATYGERVLPQLKGIREGVERLFAMGDPAADLLRVIDVRRRQIRAVEGYLDAVYEARQALIDLAAASGDLSLLGSLTVRGESVTAKETP